MHYDRIAMDCGVGDNRRYINVSAIQSKVEEKKPGSSTALLGLHSLTGCECTSSFCGRGGLIGTGVGYMPALLQSRVRIPR